MSLCRIDKPAKIRKKTVNERVNYSLMSRHYEVIGRQGLGLKDRRSGGGGGDLATLDW